MYRPRIVDSEVATLLEAVGAVVIEGPRACGKTETARQVARSEVRLDVDREARRAAALDPALILDGPAPRLIDEWQVVPELWNHVRRAVDDRGQPGQFLLTGSAVPRDDVTRHTGAARIVRVRLRPMSLFESGHASGDVSLQAVLAGEPVRAADSEFDIRRLADRVACGGWPGLLDQPTDGVLRVLRGYVDEIRRTDVQRVQGVDHDPERVHLLMRSLARHTSTSASLATLARDVGGPDHVLAKNTVGAYHEALTRLMIIEDQPAWAPHLRSRSRVRTSPKRHYVDPSLAVAALRATPGRLLEDLELLGLLFESLVIRDLRVYAQHADAQVLHYRDNTDLEVDAVVEAFDGRWAAFEVKMGSARVDNAAATLLRFAERVDTSRSGTPVLLGIVTATGYAYTRPDGVAVIPIATLGP